MATESEAEAGGGLQETGAGYSEGGGGHQETGQGYCCSWADCRRRYTTLGEHCRL